MLSPDAEIIGLCVLFAIGGTLATLIILDITTRRALRAAYEEGRRAGYIAGRASLFPHRLGGGDD